MPCLQAAAANPDGQAAGPAGPQEMDLATLLATFPPDVREDVLLNSEEAVLASLPPALLAEAQALRERSMRFMSGMGARHVHHIHDIPLGRGMHVSPSVPVRLTESLTAQLHPSNRASNPLRIFYCELMSWPCNEMASI